MYAYNYEPQSTGEPPGSKGASPNVQHAYNQLVNNLVTLRLISVKKGCVVVIFLIPAAVGDAIFADKKINPKQAGLFRALITSVVDGI